MTEIFYNNENVFSGVGAPTPLVSRQNQMVYAGERWGQIQVLTLNGVLTGCSSFSALSERQQRLLSGFKQGFKELQIKETGGVVFSMPLSKMSDISFAESVYNGQLPFSVSVECYPQSFFSGTYGIIDPIDSIQFKEEQNGIVGITHTVSAKGFVTDASTSNALSNAKSWVTARTGWNSSVVPKFISGFNNTLCLKTVSEKIDRLNATYEISETYLSDIYGSGQNGILRFSSDFQSGLEQGICTITIQGTIDGCKNDTIENVRSRYSVFNAYNQAVNEFRKITSRTDLNPSPTERSVGENSTAKKITFSYTYDDDPRPNIGVSYVFDFNYDFERDVITCGVTANLFRRGVFNTNSWSELLSFAGTIDLFPIAQAAYKEYISLVAPHLAPFPLVNKLVPISRVENEYGLEITLSANYDNKPEPPFDLEDVSYTLNFKPAIRQYIPNPILNGEADYYIFDMGYVRRGELTIDLRAVGSSALVVGKAMILNLQNEYLNGIKKTLESQQISNSNNNNSKEVSIQATYFAQQDEFTI